MSNYPMGVTSSDFDEKHVRGSFILEIEDVLGKCYATVNGVQYDTHATANVLKEDGKYEITYLDLRSIYVVLHDEVFDVSTTIGPDRLKALEDEIERIAIKQAKETPINEWDFILNSEL